jgi:hypothetical protein
MGSVLVLIGAISKNLCGATGAGLHNSVENNAQKQDGNTSDEALALKFWLGVTSNY